jgi:hypothetical protein
VGVRRVLAILLFFFFIEDSDAEYASKWISPFGWLHDFFYLKTPHMVRPLDHVFLVCLLLALRRPDGQGPRVQPMRSTLLLSAATIVVWFALGLSRGGDLRWGCWQVYILLSAVLYTFTIAAAFRTPAHFAILAKVVLFAASYRALMCWLYYFLVVRVTMKVPPDCITTHDDSVLWVVAMLILLLRLYRTKKLSERMGALALLAFFTGAVQLNSRRLAWVSLAMGLVVFFFLLPSDRAKRRTTWGVVATIPLVVVYALVGWGRSERIFKPLKAFESITTNEDLSTISRNVENLGLIHTAQANGWLFGTGWGHEYQPVAFTFDLSHVFQLWRYIPHNSILGLFAFMGAIGYFGYWLTFPTGMYLNSRMGKLSKSKAMQDLGMLGAAQMLVCVNQYFGDMGTFSYKVVYVMATSYAIALRSPIMAGVWPAGARVVRRVPAGTAVPGQAQHAQPSRATEDAWQSSYL